MRQYFNLLFFVSFVMHGGGQPSKQSSLEIDDFEVVSGKNTMEESFCLFDSGSLAENRFEPDPLSRHIVMFLQQRDTNHKLTKDSDDQFLQGTYLNTKKTLLVQGSEKPELVANLYLETKASKKDAQDLVVIRTDLLGVKNTEFVSQDDSNSSDFCSTLLKLGVLALHDNKKDKASSTMVNKGTSSLSFETHVPCKYYFNSEQ